MNTIMKFLAYQGRIQITCASMTKLIEEARKIDDLSPVATAALGRTLTMAALMGAQLKGKEDTITIQIKGNGPLGGITSTVDKALRTRGYVGNPYIEVPLREDGKLNVGMAVGNQGFLYVIKDLGLKEPYVGTSKLVTGEIAEDFTNYFFTSEQKNTAVALGVLVDKDGVKASGGYMVSAMPDATADDLFILENRIREAKPISQMLAENMSLQEITKDITGDVNLQLIEEELHPVYACNCGKEKMQRALATIGKEELKAMIEEDKGAELVCHFCNKKYPFSEQELQDLYNSLDKTK